MTASVRSSRPRPSGKPTYKQIRLDIERRILTGEWPPGHRIPFEHQLMVRYGCSRMTVSKALSELAQAELIERRRRAGTFVRRPNFLSAVLQITDIRAEISALGRSYRYELIKSTRRAASAGDRSRLGVQRTGQGGGNRLPPLRRRRPICHRGPADRSRRGAGSRKSEFRDRAAGLLAAASCPMDGSRAFDQRYRGGRSRRRSARHCSWRALPRDRPPHLAQRPDFDRRPADLSRRVPHARCPLQGRLRRRNARKTVQHNCRIHDSLAPRAATKSRKSSASQQEDHEPCVTF